MDIGMTLDCNRRMMRIKAIVLQVTCNTTDTARAKSTLVLI